MIAIDIRNPDKENWREVIAESDTPLKTVNIVSDLFLCSTLVDVTTQAQVYTLDGEFVRTIELPGLGTASGFGGRRDDTETFYSFQSMTSPPAIFRYDLVGHQSSPIERASVDMNPDDYTVEQVFFASRDGTKIPVLISYKKGLARNGRNPTLLYAYGGFNITIEPRFSISRFY